MKETKEIWKVIEGYEGYYEVSNLGRVKSLRRWRRSGKGGYFQKEKILKTSIYEKAKYFSVELYKDSKRKRMTVHRIVAQAFITNPDNKQTVNHIDGNRHNNCIENLEWCTQKENIHHALAIGTGTIGERNGLSKLTNEQVKCLRNVYKPFDSQYGCTALAKKYNMSVKCMHQMLKGETYKFI